MADQESTGLLYGTPSYEANNRWGYGPKSKSKKSMKCFIIAAVIVLLLVGSNLLMYYLAVGFYRFDEISIASQATGEVTSQSPLTAALENAVIINDATTLTPTTKHHKVDNCKGTETIPTFPNIEYSFYGYNILKGYPISDGVDPGFTRPIFDADFSSQQKTADCRYIIPDGLSAVPDEACSTDYTSHTLNTSEEYDHSLSIKASASGGFFGFKFSASFDHESTEQTIKSGEYKLIHSTAQCSTYSSSLSLYSLPPLSKDIQTWLKRLNEVFTEFDGNQDSVVFEFLDYFGTHIPSKLIYGATHTYVNKLTTSSYKALSSSSTSVNAQASYASFFSIGGGATDSNKQIVSKFQSMSETITKTLGPPPPRGGDTAAWAEAVQASPVPIQYELTEIQNIFTFDVMKTYMTKETVDKIRNKLSEIGLKYCDHVSVLSPNVKCADLPQVFPKLFLPSMVPDESYYKQHWLAESTTEEKECYAKCEVLETCIIATSFIDIVCVMAGVKDTEWDIDSISLVSLESSVRPESDLIGTRLFQNHFKRNFRLNGFQYDLSAQRCRKFKILDYYPVEYSRLSNTCGDFCRQMDGCRAFEVSNGTNYVYNCVLYSELGSSFTTVAPYDFETTFLALSPEVNSLKSNSIDFEINQVDVSGMFVVQPGCLSDECCRHTCQTDPLCLVSAFNLSASNQDCKHMYSGQSVFSVSSSLSSVSSSLSITVFPERVKANSMLQMTGLNFEKRMSDFSDVFSADECASICAAYAGCTAASWGGKTESCALHNNESLRASSQIPVRDAVLLFPAVSDGMKACQVDMSES